MAPRPFIVGNWKMNGTRAHLAEARAIDRGVQRHGGVDVALAPPFTLIALLQREVELLAVGAQDCHPDADGAFTGDISATMLADAGASFVILGHSERRIGHGEGAELLRAKRHAAQAAGLRVILCCGEDLPTREAGRAEEFVLAQLEAILPDEVGQPGELTVAYEPIWAIGTGRVAEEADILAMHGAIRQLLTRRYGQEGASVRILYGGSVKPDNARQILALADVDGALVGGASLTAESFLGIVVAAAEPEAA